MRGVDARFGRSRFEARRFDPRWSRDSLKYHASALTGLVAIVSRLMQGGITAERHRTGAKRAIGWVNYGNPQFTLAHE
jgi:hypothetical protein